MSDFWNSLCAFFATHPWPYLTLIFITLAKFAWDSRISGWLHGRDQKTGIHPPEAYVKRREQRDGNATLLATAALLMGSLWGAVDAQKLSIATRATVAQTAGELARVQAIVNPPGGTPLNQQVVTLQSQLNSLQAIAATKDELRISERCAAKVAAGLDKMPTTKDLDCSQWAR